MDRLGRPLTLSLGVTKPEHATLVCYNFTAVTMYRLHGFCQSGPTFKVAFLLRALNQPWEAKFVDYMNGVTRTGEWRDATNEMGEVPVLDDGGRRLTQSGVILTYLASKHGCLLYTSPSPRDGLLSRMPSSA